MKEVSAKVKSSLKASQPASALFDCDICLLSLPKAVSGAVQNPVVRTVRLTYFYIL